MSDQSKKLDIYKQLGVKKDSSSQVVHKQFLKQVSTILIKLKNTPESNELMDELRLLWVAHDILMDPDCRTDYDLRCLGITTEDRSIEDDFGLIAYGTNSKENPKPPSWRIGELLQATGLLEQAELEIACDMHKAMPEMQFGRFLVKQGFLTEPQLRAVLIGQALIRTGEINLSEFMKIMTEVNKSNRSIKEVLLEYGSINNAILLKLDLDD